MRPVPPPVRRPRCAARPRGAAVLRLFTGSPRLTRAMDAVGAAVPGSRHGHNSEMLAALEEVVDQSREVSAQVRLVHCQTTNGRAGQQLALHALALAEQAGGYLRAGLSSSDPDKTKADLSQGVTLSRESLNTGRRCRKAALEMTATSRQKGWFDSLAGRRPGRPASPAA